MTNLCHQIENVRKASCPRYYTTKTGQHCTKMVGCCLTVASIIHAKCVNLRKTIREGRKIEGMWTCGLTKSSSPYRVTQAASTDARYSPSCFSVSLSKTIS